MHKDQELRAIMAVHDLSPDDVAEMLCRSKSIVYQWRSRKHGADIPDDLLLKLKRMLRVENES